MKNHMTIIGIRNMDLATCLKMPDFVSIEPTGGIFCFIGHQLSSILLIPKWHIPILKHIAFFLNKWLIVKFCCFCDTIIDKRKNFALGYTCVVEKK